MKLPTPSDQLDFSVGDLIFAEISVDYVDGKEKTLWRWQEID